MALGMASGLIPTTVADREPAHSRPALLPAVDRRGRRRRRRQRPLARDHHGGSEPLAATGGFVGVVIGLLFLGVVVYLALRLRAGDHWARLALTILGGISAVFTVLGVLLTAGLGVSIGAVSTIVSLLQAALIVAAILFAFQGPANAYFR